MITPDESNDREEYINGARKDTYSQTDNKTTAEYEIRPQWDLD